MTDTIRPDSIVDFNAVGRTTGTKADLAGMEFLIHCPPDLPPRSRIVSLCGITDWGDGASPQKDGWFISDFYLFHHLLRPRGKFVSFLGDCSLLHMKLSGLKAPQILYQLTKSG
jgi:hypothetical protein